MYRLISLLFVTTVSIFGAQNVNDLDNDLVPNSIDKCPNTPEAVFVTKDGCTKTIKRVVYFNTGSSFLHQKYSAMLKKTAEIINELTGYKVEISGHTDSIAGYKINMALSEKRASTVCNTLLQNKVDEKRITTSWYGETMPVSSNVTAMGRAENRRVTILLK